MRKMKLLSNYIIICDEEIEIKVNDKDMLEEKIVELITFLYQDNIIDKYDLWLIQKNIEEKIKNGNRH